MIVVIYDCTMCIAQCTSNLWVISHGLHVGSHKGKVEENNVSEKCWKIGKGFNEALFKEASKSEKNYRGYQSTRLSKCLRIIIKVKSTLYRFAEEWKPWLEAKSKKDFNLLGWELSIYPSVCLRWYVELHTGVTCDHDSEFWWELVVKDKES